MAAPVVAALVWGYRAYRSYAAYETAQTAIEAAETLAQIQQRKKDVEALLKDVIKGMKEEIDIKSSTFVRTGGNVTVSRGRSENVTYQQYIERKIPFRPIISTVCQWALKSPLKVPRRIRKRIPGEVIDTTIDIALKQTTASLVFEAVDDLLAWQSPLKAEPNYDAASRAPLLGEPATRPKRISEYFPFWPRPRGSLAKCVCSGRDQISERLGKGQADGRLRALDERRQNQGRLVAGSRGLHGVQTQHRCQAGSGRAAQERQMSTSHHLLNEDDLSGMVADLKRWPNVAIDHGPFELAVTPYLTFYFTYEPVHFLQTTFDMVDIHRAFERLLGYPYLIATHPDSERPHPYGSKKLGDLREWIIKTPLEETFTVKFTDEKNHQSSPTHAAYLWREPTLGQREQCYSSIQFYYRWQWWLDNKDAWRKFVLDTIARLKPAQVYCGFSMGNPLEFGTRSEVAVWDRALAPHFYGLDTDYPFGMMFTPDLPSGIRPPTWGFFLSDPWRKMLSMTREEVAASLNDPRIRIDTLGSGQWIELGPQPELYPVEQGLPELPVTLNRLLRRIRHPQLDLIGSGEWDGDPNERFNRRDTQRWLARFDDDSDWPTPEIRGLAPRDPLVEPTPTHVAAGERIPTEGWWYTLAKHGSRQYFKAGELGPSVFQGATRGRVIWQRDIDQHDAKPDSPSPAPPGAVRVRSGEPCPYPGLWVCEDEPSAPQSFTYQTPMPRVNGRDVSWAMVKFLR